MTTPAASLLLLRPGALGDVIALRGAIGWLQEHHPEITICLAAPASRADIFLLGGRVDRVYDLDRADAAWLFAAGDGAPPEMLAAALGAPDLAIAYWQDTGGAACNNLLRLGARHAIDWPARPAAALHRHIHDFLTRPLHHLLAGDEEAPAAPAVLPVSLTDTMAIRQRLGIPAGPVAVLHPGSGSPAKNWPCPSFARLASELARRYTVVVTTGEADGSLGTELTARAPDAILAADLPLRSLAALLATADLYVGNDSGVTHLACAVRPESGPAGRRVALFGPTDPVMWAPPEARVVAAPDGDLAGLSVRAVLAECGDGAH